MWATSPRTIAWAAVDAGCDFSLGVTRNKAAWRAAATIPADAWTRALRMKGAQVAVMDYAPAGWPPRHRLRSAAGACAGLATSRPTRGPAAGAPSRKTSSLWPWNGAVDQVYAYSFIATNLDVSTPAKAAALQAWHRMRTDIEDRIRDAKHGAALRHLPSGDRTINAVWRWAALLAVNMSAWLQELAGLDNGDGRGRAHLGTLRRRLLGVPARLVRHAHHVMLRLPPGHDLLARVLPRLRRLPVWT
jgi:hypothetical protein